MTADRTDTDRDVGTIAREHLRAVDEAEAQREEILAEWAAEYYRPGYLDDDDWDLLKRLLEVGEHDGAFTVIEVAAYRKAATELGLEDEVDEWPARE